MPFYEYKASDPEKSCEYCKDIFETLQSIVSDSLTECPECGNKVDKLISSIGGVVFKGRQMNQYADVLQAKYWRDQNGVRHKVGPGDGSPNSPTVPRRQTASPEEVQARIKRDSQADKSKRTNDSYKRFVKRNKLK